MANQNPKVSIIMNCFNGAEYLDESLQSVINQSYTNWELIFWDNQSTDNSREIVERYLSDTRIKYFYAPKHTVLGKARKEAIERSSGEWIGFLDTDDIWHTNKVLAQIERIQRSNKEDQIGLVYTPARVFGNIDKEKLTPDFFPGKQLPEGLIHKQLLFGNFIPLVTGLISKVAYEKLGSIPENLKFAADYWLYLGVTKYYRAAAVQEVTASYRIHGSNWTKRQVIEQVEEPIEIVNFYVAKLDQEERTRAFNKQIEIRIAERIIVLLFKFKFSDFFRISSKYSRMDYVFYYGIKYLLRILIRGY